MFANPRLQRTKRLPTISARFYVACAVLSGCLLVATGCSQAIRQEWGDGYRIEGHYTVSDPDTIYDASGALAFLVGSVVDRETGGVLPGAVVRTSNLEHGAHADSLGRFRLALPPGTYVFEAGSVGFDELSTSPLPMVASTIVHLRFELGMTVVY